MLVLDARFTNNKFSKCFRRPHLIAEFAPTQQLMTAEQNGTSTKIQSQPPDLEEQPQKSTKGHAMHCRLTDFHSLEKELFGRGDNQTKLWCSGPSNVYINSCTKQKSFSNTKILELNQLALGEKPCAELSKGE